MSELENKEHENLNEAAVHPDAEVEKAAEPEVDSQDVDPIAETNRALESVKVELESVIKTAKSAFEDLKKQLAPLRDGISEVGETLKNLGTENAENADGSEKEPRKIFVVGEAEAEEDASEGDDEDDIEDEEDDADDVEDEDDADDTEDEDAGASDADDDAPGRELDMKVVASAAHEASDLLSDGFNKLKSHASNIKFDFKSAISKEFEQYADENLKDADYEVDENGKRVVKIDGKFVQEHASDVVPALIRGAVGSFFKAFLGTDILADESEKRDSDKEASQAEAAADKAEEAESKYRVQFDFSNALKDAIRTAKVTPAAETAEEVKDREAGREVLIEGAQLVEDAMNGKSTDDARDRLAAAYKHGSLDESEKAPEEIHAVDEKHQKILDLAKQFENSVSPDHSDQEEK